MIDDSWRDSYDEWKLACPYDDEPQDDCCHEEYEVDWEGRAECHYCGAHWRLTGAEHEAYLAAEARWMEAYDRAQRREHSLFWRAVDWLRSIPSRIRLLRRKKAESIVDDIPF